MAPPKAAYYTQIPSQPQQEQNYVVLPLYYPFRSRGFRIFCILCPLIFLTAVYIFWPSDPEAKIVRLRLSRINVHTVPHITVDITMLLTVRVRNADLYSMDYKSLDVAVGYRGKRLGHVKSNHGHVKARGSSYVDAKLEFAGIGVLSDVVFLLEDLAKGMVQFDTLTEVTGQFGFFFLDFPLQVIY